MQSRLDLDRAADSVGERAIRQMERLWGAVVGTPADEAVALVRDLFSRWGDRPLGATPAWPTNIADDHSPYELSVAFSDEPPELRVLFEAQADTPTLQRTVLAGLAVCDRWKHEHGADLSRLIAIEDLFLPSAPTGRFGLWHAVSLRPGHERTPDFKLYLNPQVSGAALAPALVEQMLLRLGYPRAWPAIAAAMRRGPVEDELRYVSLDLTPGPAARLKVYVFHHRASVELIEEVAALARHRRPGAVGAFCRAVLGSDGPYAAAPIGTCFSFVDGDTDRASTATVHMPIRFYGAHDEVSLARVHAGFASAGLDTRGLDAAVSAMAGRRLEDGIGLISYASLRVQERPRITVYLSAEAYQVTPPRGPLKVVPSQLTAHAAEPPEAIVRRHETTSLVIHPFFQRLRREAVDLGRLWSLLANIRVAITRDFARRLASVVYRIDDVRVRSILCKQLNDELGDGDAARAHSLLFDRLVDGLEAKRPRSLPPAWLGPGEELSRRLEILYTQRPPWEGVGAAMVIEIFGKQVDCFLGDEFRRQSAVPASVLEWLTLHESLEHEHAEESLDLARLVPEAAAEREAVSRGAHEIGDAGWAFLDGMYPLVFHQD